MSTRAGVQNAATFFNPFFPSESIFSLLFCLAGSSQCTVSCTQTPPGVPLRLSSEATAPFSSSSPSSLGI